MTQTTPRTAPHPPAKTRARLGVRHLRTDTWWVQPLLTFLGLLAFVIYGTWVAFINRDYFVEPYLSPFYSPCLGVTCPDSPTTWRIFGEWWPFSPAILILIFPLGFRLTCYYYRKSYYRSFWLSPPACAVAEPHRRYTGERRFPLIFQNVHRYFWYAAMVFPILLGIEAVWAFRDEHGEWGHMGLGTVVLWVNVVLLFLYTVSCHSCRHITLGRLNNFSAHPVRYRLWTWVSKLNARHMELAWVSMVSVGLADLYVRLLAAGVISDPRFF